MSNVLLKIDPQHLGLQLKAGREASGLTQGEVAKEMKFARTTLVAIEKGERRVTSRELACFAKLYRKNLSDWLGAKSEAMPLVPQFRSTTRQATETKAIMKSVSELEELSRNYLELEKMAGFSPSKQFPQTYQHRIPGASAEQRGEEVAAQERARLSLGDNPIQDLRSVLEDTIGIRIFYLDLPSAVGGIYAFSEELGACMAINRLHPATRANWSLAHEYGHFLSTRTQADVSFSSGSHWGKSVDEKFADSFAKHFLMPRDGVNQALSDQVLSHGRGVTVADVLSLSHRFRVSAEAMFRRLEELKRLPLGTWDKLRGQQFQPDRAKQTLGLELTNEKEESFPFRYRMLLREAYDRRDSEITEAALGHFLHCDLVSARDELDRMRVLADNRSEEGYDPVDLDSGLVLVEG